MSEQEHNIQVACVTWFRYQFPNYVCFAVPNGSKRPKQTKQLANGAVATYSAVAKKLKDEGALAGVADLVLVGWQKTVFVEMKTPTGRQQESQKNFEAKVTKLGHEYHVCHSLEEFMAVCKAAFYKK